MHHPTLRTHRRRLGMALLGTLLALQPVCRSAAVADDVKLAAPFVVINVASVDRALTDIAWMFNSIQRSDMNTVVTGLLGQAGDLKGVDRTRPFGQIVFLDTEALPPRPAAVFFIPVTNLTEALQTVTKAPVVVRKTIGREDEYELLGQEDGDGVQAVIRIIGSYAFITPEEMKSILDVMPDIERVSQSLASRYDAAVTIQVKAIPKGVRQVFVNFLRTQAEIDLQRRDDEPEEQYLVRRANGLSALEFIEQLALQGEDLTIGWNADPEQHSGYLDVILNATPDSEFAQHLSAVASKPSMFAALRTIDRPLTVNVSWVMNKREQAAATGLLKALRVVAGKGLPDLAEPGGPIEQMYDSLQATCDAGHFDLFLQFHAAGVQEFVLLGGLKLAGGQAFAQALERLLQGIVVKLQDGKLDAAVAANAPTITINADAHQGVSFHKLTPKRVGNDEERLYGGTPDVYLGASSRALWFCVGGREAMPALRDSLDTLLNTPPAERSAAGNVPISVTVRVAPWLKLPLPEAPEADESLAATSNDATPDEQARREAINRFRARRAERARDRQELANQAFNATDGIRIEGRPLESGFRTRIHLDEGFVRMLGLFISREYDRSQL